MITRSAKSYLKSNQSATGFFRSRNFHVDFFRLDNDTSGPLEKFMKANARSSQYVPHRSNMAEIKVRGGKTNFVTIICDAHPSFHFGEWDLLITYVKLTLNLFRQFCPNPSKSDAYALDSLHPTSDPPGHLMDTSGTCFRSLLLLYIN